MVGNFFLLLVYALLLAYGAKQINGGSDRLLEIFEPGLIGGVLLPTLGAFPDAAVIFVSVWSATATNAQEQVKYIRGRVL